MEVLLFNNGIKGNGTNKLEWGNYLNKLDFLTHRGNVAVTVCCNIHKHIYI